MVKEVHRKEVKGADHHQKLLISSSDL